jgi:hypothetical protein
MKKNRYVLCLLLCGWMIYFALPRLAFFSEGEVGVFALAWLGLALMVIAGNLSALLYNSKQRKKIIQPTRNKRKIRSYNG